MSPLPKDFKNELRAKANASLQRHFQSLEEENRKIKYEPPSPEMLTDFASHLQCSNRILVLIGAGLSASSGIPTYRSARGFWGTYSDQQLANKDAFEENPVLVWQFYNYKRQQAKTALPNPAHFALAELAKKKSGLLSVNQNVDELCQRAGHPESQIHNLHGSLFRVRCLDDECGYEVANDDVPIISQLPVSEPPGVLESADIDSHPHGCIIEDLPHCPQCQASLLRPAIVWFGEGLPETKVKQIDEWLRDGEAADSKVDLMMVIGTSAMVWPAAGYIGRARKAGARVAFFNIEAKTAGVAKPEDSDWVFLGDAAKLIPQAFESVLRESEQVER